MAKAKVELNEIPATSKNVFTKEAILAGYDFPEINKYWAENYKGKRGSGLNAKFDELLIEGVEMSVEDIEAFIEENDGNKTSLKSFLVSRYNLAKAIRDNIA